MEDSKNLTLKQEAAAFQNNMDVELNQQNNNPVIPNNFNVPLVQETSEIVPGAVNNNNPNTTDISNPPMDKSQKSSAPTSTLSHTDVNFNTSNPQLSLSSTIAAAKSEPALSWQIPPSALAPKKIIKNEKIEKLEQRIADDVFDTEAWTALLVEAQAKSDPEKVRETFERFLKQFPTSARQWVQYAEFELKHNQYEKVEEIFRRCLRNVLSVDLWKFYLNYIRRKNAGEKPNTAMSPSSRSTVEKAYEYVLNHIGIDMGAGNIWGDYLFFLKTAETNNMWEEQQKMDQMRKTFQRAICIPIHNVEHIWKEYDAFENGLNKITAKKFLQERSSLYMTARTALRELRSITEDINKNVIPVSPKWTNAELQQLDAWKRWLSWEKSNPLALEDKSQLAQRIIYTYKQAMMYLRYYPEIWYEASSYWIEIGKEEDAANLLKTAMGIMPTSFLIYFAYAELQERHKKFDEARKAFEDLLSNLSDQIKSIETSHEAEIKALMNPPESVSEEGGFTEMDGEMREQLRIKEKEKEKERIRIEEKKKAEIQEIARGCSTVWIMLMRFERRTEGMLAVRSVFSRARKSPYCTYHVFVASALIEYHCNKEPTVAGKIFELGLKTYGDNPEYVVQYLDFLIQLNDDNNTRALFERTLLTLPAEKAKIVWERFSNYENNYGDLTSLRKIDERRAEKYAEESPLKRFAERYSYLNINIIQEREIGEKPTTLVNSSDSPPDTVRSTHAVEDERDSQTSRRALLDSVQPEKYPRPDFRQWVAYKPTPEQLKRPFFPPGNPGQGSIPPEETSSQPLGFQTPAREQASAIRPSPPPRQPSPASQSSSQPGPVIWKRGSNGMLLPEALATFLSNLPSASAFPVSIPPMVSPMDLIDLIRNSNILAPPGGIVNGVGQSIQSQHTLQPPPGIQPRDMSRGGSPGRSGGDIRGGGYGGVDGRYTEGGRGGYERGQDNLRGGYGGTGGGGPGRARQGEFFGKQMRGPNQPSGRGRANGGSLGGDMGPQHFGGNVGSGAGGGKRRRRDFEGENEEFQGRGGPGINRPPDYDLFRTRQQQKRTREGVLYGSGGGGGQVGSGGGEI